MYKKIYLASGIASLVGVVLCIIFLETGKEQAYSYTLYPTLGALTARVGMSLLGPKD